VSASPEVSCADAAIAYVKNGLALVAIPSGQKGPRSIGWNARDKAITSPADAANITGNIGLAHAYCTPYPTAALDIDDMAQAEQWLKAWGLDLRALLDASNAVQIISGRQGRAKTLYILPRGEQPMRTVQVKDPVTKSVILEFRCASADGLTMQDVLPPSIHPDTGQPYKWGGKGDPACLPTMPDKLLDVWRAAMKPANQPDPGHATGLQARMPEAATELDPATKQDLRSALFHINADDRDSWIKCGLALKSLGEACRSMWIDWSLTSAKGDPREAAKTWDGLRPRTLDHTYVFAEAQRHGWTSPAKSLPTIGPAQSEAWPALQPLPKALRPVKSLDTGCLPTSIRPAVVDIADRFQCPIDYVATPLLVGAGAIVGNRIGILPKQHDDSWEVHPVFWGGIVGPPGSMKTPAQEQALKGLRQIEEQDHIAYAVRAAQYHLDKKRYEKELASFKAGKVTTIPVEPTEPSKPRLIVNDTTYQALGVILAANPNGVLIHGDEMSGLLQSLDTPGQEAARGFYLSGWGGTGSYTFDRIGRPSVHLPNYALSIFGGFQPDKIKLYVRAAQGGSSQNDGLLQRFQLLAWPDIGGAFSLVDREPDRVAIAQMNAAMLALRGVSSGSLKSAVTNRRGAQLLHFSPESQEVFDTWFLANEQLVRGDSLGSDLQTHFAKYRSLIPGLALLFHLLEGHQGPVCCGCLSNAIAYASYLKSHAYRLYGAVNGQDNAAVRALGGRLVKGDLVSGFTCRTVYRKGWSELGDEARVTSAVEQLVELGWLRERVVVTEGRKKVEYDVSPLICAALL
jgi:hypothetical protein